MSSAGQDDPGAVEEMVALAWERIRTYPPHRSGPTVPNILRDVRKRYRRHREIDAPRTLCLSGDFLELLCGGPSRRLLEQTSPPAEDEAVARVSYGEISRAAHAAMGELDFRALVRTQVADLSAAQVAARPVVRGVDIVARDGHVSDPAHMDISGPVRSRRVALGLSQAELAKAASVSLRQLGRYEPRASTLCRAYAARVNPVGTALVVVHANKHGEALLEVQVIVSDVNRIIAPCRERSGVVGVRNPQGNVEGVTIMLGVVDPEVLSVRVPLNFSY